MLCFHTQCPGRRVVTKWWPAAEEAGFVPGVGCGRAAGLGFGVRRHSAPGYGNRWPCGSESTTQPPIFTLAGILCFPSKSRARGCYILGVYSFEKNLRFWGRITLNSSLIGIAKNFQHCTPGRNAVSPSFLRILCTFYDILVPISAKLKTLSMKVVTSPRIPSSVLSWGGYRS